MAGVVKSSLARGWSTNLRPQKVSARRKRTSEPAHIEGQGRTQARPVCIVPHLDRQPMRPRTGQDVLRDLRERDRRLLTDGRHAGAFGSCLVGRKPSIVIAVEEV